MCLFRCTPSIENALACAGQITTKRRKIFRVGQCLAAPPPNTDRLHIMIAIFIRVLFFGIVITILHAPAHSESGIHPTVHAHLRTSQLAIYEFGLSAGLPIPKSRSGYDADRARRIITRLIIHAVVRRFDNSQQKLDIIIREREIRSCWRNCQMKF